MSIPDHRFPVALLWHTHQPEYRVDGEFRLSWVYAHTLKDYSDMAAHLEAVPQARAVINFSPVLLEQLDDYAQRLQRHQCSREAIGDPLLDALVALPFPGPQRARLARLCLQVDSPRQLARDDAQLALLPDEPLAALLVGWHLAWTGESVLAAQPQLAALRGRERYGIEERRLVLAAAGEVLRGLIPRYRALAQRGAVELSMSPYQHALLPLLLDFGAAHEARPDAALPAGSYPGGARRVQWQLEQGRAVYERVLGLQPSGCWPSEAALSDAVLRPLEAAGYAWTASSQCMLEASLRRAGAARAHRAQSRPVSGAHRSGRRQSLGAVRRQRRRFRSRPVPRADHASAAAPGDARRACRRPDAAGADAAAAARGQLGRRRAPDLDRPAGQEPHLVPAARSQAALRRGAGPLR